MEVNFPSQLGLLLGAAYRTTLASAEQTVDTNLLAVLEYLSDLLMQSAVKSSLLTFSASAYITSSSASVICNPPPRKSLRLRKTAVGLGAVPMLLGSSC